jgi:hypothetical protein
VPVRSYPLYASSMTLELTSRYLLANLPCVRGRSSKEIAENSPIIVSTAGAIGPTLTVETSPISTSSSLSLLAAPTSTAGPTRTYTCDKVFGPEADQGMLWDEVVRETLDEVMMGYNCTIFAYGQTGTGKTYVISPARSKPLTALLTPQRIYWPNQVHDAGRSRAQHTGQPVLRGGHRPQDTPPAVCRARLCAVGTRARLER